VKSLPPHIPGANSGESSFTIVYCPVFHKLRDFLPRQAGAELEETPSEYPESQSAYVLARGMFCTSEWQMIDTPAPAAYIR
jgi:hypothetical protein